MLLGPQIKKRQDVCRLKLSKILLATIIARKRDWPNGGKVRLGGASFPFTLVQKSLVPLADYKQYVLSGGNPLKFTEA